MTTLRLATFEDAEALSVLAERTFLDTFVRGFSIPYPAEDLAVFGAKSFSIAAIQASLRDPSRWWLVAVQGGALVGFAEAGACGLPHPEATPADGELKRLYVDLPAQRQRLGQAMLERTLEWLENRARGPLWLGVWSGNLKAQKLYTHYGFTKAGEYDFPVGSWLDREFIMRRQPTCAP